MKRAFIPLVCMAALSADVHQDDHTHPDLNETALYNFTAEVGLGYAGMYVKDSHVNDTAHISTKTKYTGAPGLAVHGRVGFQYEFDNEWSLGFGAYGQYNTSEYTQTITAPNVIRTSTVVLDGNVGPDVRVGYSNDENTTFYASVAPDWAHYKLTNESTINSVYKKNWVEDFMLGIRAGMGAYQKIDENWYFQGQFDYSWFSSQNLEGEDSSKNSFKFNLVSSIFSIGYMF